LGHPATLLGSNRHKHGSWGGVLCPGVLGVLAFIGFDAPSSSTIGEVTVCRTRMLKATICDLPITAVRLSRWGIQVCGAKFDSTDRDVAGQCGRELAGRL